MTSWVQVLALQYFSEFNITLQLCSQGLICDIELGLLCGNKVTLV
jgi:hypothetical protein